MSPIDMSDSPAIDVLPMSWLTSLPPARLTTTSSPLPLYIEPPSLSLDVTLYIWPALESDRPAIEVLVALIWLLESFNTLTASVMETSAIDTSARLSSCSLLLLTRLMMIELFIS